MKKTLFYGLTTALLATMLTACPSAGTNPGGNPGGGNPGGNPGGGNPGGATAYTMTGVVRNVAGQPLAGVEVFADHTAYYNMNADGVTNAQGQYRIALSNQPGTWAPGAYITRTYGKDTFKLRVYADDDTPFDGAVGAVRDFTFDPNGKDMPPLSVNTYIAHSNVELDYDTLELTFKPDGPMFDGSTGAPFTRKWVKGYGIQNVPLGRYYVSATHVLNGAKQQLLLSSEDQPEFKTEALAMYHDTKSRYGITMELSFKNP